MKKILTTLSILIVIACNTSPHQEQSTQAEPPNIILLIGDDQGYPYFGFMGADYVYTPNMDSLAASGTLFTDGYVPANHCRPSLQSLMTGTLPIDYQSEVQTLLKEKMSTMRFASEEEKAKFKTNFQHHAMSQFETLPKLLAAKGYNSFQGGKWWEFNYQNGGFTHGMTTGWTAEDRKNGGKWFKQFMGGSGLQLARATMQPVYDFIDDHSEQPFFIWYAPELPHYPLNAPPKYYDLYKDKKMSESAKRYYANCSWFDDGVGELIRYLKKKGEFENTLFVYVNDNGWEQAPDQEFRHDSLRWHNGGDKGKLSMYDQSFRTPIIFSWANHIEAGQRKADLMHSADIPATILDYLNLEIPDPYFGQSYRTVIENTATAPRPHIIGNINQTRSEEDMMGQRLEGYWMRTPDWFFNWDATNDVHSLYNVNIDPNNDDNVATAHPELVAEFSARLEAWKELKKGEGF